MGSGLSCSCCSGDAPDNKEVIQRSDSSTEPDYHFAPPETRQFDVQPALQKPTRSESFYSDSKTPAINVSRKNMFWRKNYITTLSQNTKLRSFMLLGCTQHTTQSEH